MRPEYVLSKLKEGRTPITSKVVSVVCVPHSPEHIGKDASHMGTIMVFLEDGRCYEIQEIKKHLLEGSEWQSGFSVPGTPAWYREELLADDSDFVDDAHWEK